MINKSLIIKKIVEEFQNECKKETPETFYLGNLNSPNFDPFTCTDSWLRLMREGPHDYYIRAVEEAIKRDQLRYRYSSMLEQENSDETDTDRELSPGGTE